MFSFKYQSQSGQVLLLIVLFITSLMTVVMAISFRAARDTQLTLAQTEVSDLSFVAETAVEQAITLRSEDPDGYGPGTVLRYDDLFTLSALSNVTFPNVSLTSSSVRIEEQYISEAFETPPLEKDQQYMVYLSAYRPLVDDTIQFDDAYDNGLEISVRTVDDTNGKNCNNVAVELTVIYQPNNVYEIARYVMDKEGLITEVGDSKNFVPERVSPTPGVTECRASLSVLNNADEEVSGFGELSNKRILIARVFYTDETIEEVTLVFHPQNNAVLPPQGISFISEAVSVAGLRRTVTVFQSYPQIPADLFVTQF